MPLLGAPNVENLQARGRVKALIRALEYRRDPEVRRAAAIALGELGDGAAVEPLIAALQGRELRREAADALGRIGDVRAVEALLIALEDADPEVRAAAAGALGQIGDRRASQPLIEAFADDEYAVREAVVAALQRMGADTEDLLHAALTDGSKAIREGAMRALDARHWTPAQDAAAAHYWILKEEWDKVVELGAEAVEPLIQASQEEGLGADVARALGRIGDPCGVQGLTLLAQDSDESVRLAAGSALGAIGDPVALATLLQMLDDKVDTVRRAAAEALGKLGDPMAVEYLLQAMDDESWHVRQGIVEALGALGDARAIEPLVAAFGDDNPSVRTSAEEALRKIDGPIEAPLIVALTDRQRVVRDRASRALEERGWQPPLDSAGAAFHIVRRQWDALPALGAAALEPLLVALHDTWVSDGIITALVAIGEPAVEPLVGLLAETEAPGRKAIIEALGKIGDERAVPPLVGLLSTDESLRVLVSQALGQIGGPAVEPLMALLESPEVQRDEALHQAVAQTLVKTGAPAVGPLIALLDNEALAETASDALVKIGAPAVQPTLAALRDETRSQAAIEVLSSLDADGIQELVSSITAVREWTPEDVARLWEVAARVPSAELWTQVSEGLHGALEPEGAPVAPPEHVGLVARLLSHEADEREAAAHEVEALEELEEARALARAYRANRLLAEALCVQEAHEEVDVDRALLEGHEALRLEPCFSAALVAMSMLYRRYAAQPELALGWVMQALALVDEEAALGAEGDNPHAWVELGEVRAALGDPVSATAAFMGATYVGPDLTDARPYLRLMEVYKRLGMLEELYAAMEVAARVGGAEPDLDQSWADLVSQVEASALKAVVSGLPEEQVEAVAPSEAITPRAWEDSEHV